MPDTVCYTSATFSYLDRARVWAESVKRFHPDWTTVLLLSDVAPSGFEFDPVDEPFDRVVHISELQIDDWQRWMFGHDIVELCTAVKGPMMHRLLEEGYSRVVYLDPDTALFAPLNEMLSMLDKHSIVLTPHVTRAATHMHDIIDNEISSLQHGVYNLGFVAVSNTTSGREYGAWWRDRLKHFCHDDVPNGLFTDQRWCDLVPALFDNVGVLRHPGYNVASWNLGHRPITVTKAGDIFAGEAPLRFFHFTKVNAVGEHMLERYSYGRTDVFELLRWYRERLTCHSAQGLPAGWWAYGTYADGTPISKGRRLIWRTRSDARQLFSNPYATGPGSFKAWCDEHGL